jgi:arylsulfatase
MYGKWHLGRTEGRFPTDQGFDEWYGIPNTTDESAWTSLEQFKSSGLEVGYVLESKKGSTPTKVRVYDIEYRALIDRELTNRALNFMERSVDDKKPFFIYLPYTATHFPTIPHPDFDGKTGNGAWADILSQIDSYLGQLQDKVDELGITENTLFIFTADNGPEATHYNSTSITVEIPSQGSAGPWRGTLFTGFEGGLRVPFVAKWPGKIAAGSVSDEIVHAMDLFPTLAKITGGTVPKDRIIDGIDASDLILGNSKVSKRDGFVVYMGDEIFGVKWKNWKLHFEEQDSWNTIKHSYTMPRVYDLYNDPQERNNVVFPHTWVPKAALGQLQEHVLSLKKNPPILPGQEDPYEPK